MRPMVFKKDHIEGGEYLTDGARALSRDYRKSFFRSLAVRSVVQSGHTNEYELRLTINRVSEQDLDLITSIKIKIAILLYHSHVHTS